MKLTTEQLMKKVIRDAAKYSAAEKAEIRALLRKEFGKKFRPIRTAMR